MNNESVDGQMQEIVAEGDEISSAQPLSQELPRVADPPGSNNVPSPASNLAATDREPNAAAAQRRKRRSKQARANVAPATPFAMGLTTPYTDPYGYWSGQGQHFQMLFQPQVPLLAPSPGLASWYTPPNVPKGMQGMASHNPSSSRRWVPFLVKNIFLWGNIYWLGSPSVI